MKKIYSHPLFLSIIPIFVTMLFPFISEQFQKSKSIYDISNMHGNNGSLGIIELKNRSNDIQNDLYFEIYSFQKVSIEAEGIINYKITKSQNDSLNYILVVNNLLPGNTGKILFFSSRASTQATFVNSEAMNYFSEKELALSQLNMWNRQLWNIILMSLFSLIFYLIMTKFQKYIEQLDLKITTERDKQIEGYTKQYNEFKEKHEILNIELAAAKNSTNEKIREVKKEMYTIYAKQRIIWLSRARAYQKELNFWKTIISKKILEDKDLNPNDLHKYVTNSLKTFETLVDIESGLTSSELSFINHLEELNANIKKIDDNI